MLSPGYNSQCTTEYIVLTKVVILAMHVPISISIDKKLIERIDREKGLATRSRFIEAKLKEVLNRQ